MEPLLNEDISKQVREVFNQLVNPVQILFFSKKENCDQCAETRQLLEEVAALSEKIEIDTYDLEENSEEANRYQIDKAPGFAIVGKDADEIIDYGIRFYGIPSGHEFSSLIHDLILVSGRDSGLSESTREFLKKIDKPVHLMVFVTPT